MDLPATQAVDEEEFAPTQKFKTNENNENSLVGMLLIENKEHFIISGISTIGRHPACTIIINHETVSKKHAEIEAESVDEPLFIKDLCSCNMTKINNTKLRSNSSYQIKDGDKLSFGQVIATFKLCNTSDNSFVASTPQINKKIQSLIPGTPDSSIDASSTSESDVSTIPGTQMEKISKSFQSPEILNQNSMNSENTNSRHLSLNHNNFLSSLSKSNCNQDDISEIQTQKFSTSDVKEDFNNSIYRTEIQKCTSENKCTDSDENIYKMKTQRLFELNEDKNDIENLKTGQFNYENADYNKKNFKNLTIYSADTQEISPETLVNESITNSKMQQFNTKLSDSVEEKVKYISIYNAETEKINDKVTINESIENLETQQFNYRKSDCNEKKFKDISIYNAETQKINLETSIDTLENFETQKFNNTIFDSVREKFNNEHEQSIYTTEKQILEPEKLIDESVENIETQKFHKIKSNEVQTSVRTMDVFLQNIKTHSFHYGKSDLKKKEFSNSVEIQKNTSKTFINESVENLEKKKNILNEDVNDLNNDFDTQCLEHVKSTNLPIHISSKRKTVEKSLYEIKTYNSISEKLMDKCQKDLKTQEFSNKSSSATLNKSIENIESQNYVEQHSKNISGSEFTVKNIEEIQLMKENVSINKKTKDSNIQHVDEFSFDSGFRTAEQESDSSKSNSIQSRDGNILNLQDLKSLANSPFYKINKSITINDLNRKNDLQNKKYNAHSENKSYSLTAKKFDTSISLINSKQMEDLFDNGDENKMDFSQNLIHDYPFEFLSEESYIDDQSTSMQKTSTKIEKYKNEHNINNTFKANENINSRSLNKDQENLTIDDLLNQTYKISESNSKINKSVSTRENGRKVFYKNNYDNKTKVYKEAESDSETDEEGIFSNYLPKEINKSSSINNVENKSDINREKKIEKCTNKKIEEDLNSSKIQITSFKQNDLIFESSISDSEDSMFAECDEEKKSFDQRIENSFHSNNLKQNESTKTLFNITSFREKMDVLSPSKIVKANVFETKNLNSIPNQVMSITKSSNTKLSNINAETSKNDLKIISYEIAPDQVIDDIERKLLLKSSKRQSEELEVKFNKKSKHSSNTQNEKIYINTSFEKNIDENKKNSVKEEPVSMNHLTNILESNQIEENKNIDSNLFVLSPTFSRRKNSTKVKKNRKLMLLEKKNSMYQKKKHIVNLNDTIERNLNEMFDNTINTIEEYKVDNMLTQQLKSALQSPDDSQSDNKEIIKEKSLSLSVNSEKKHRLNLSLNLSNFSTSKNQDEQKKCIQFEVKFKSELDKQKITLQESNISKESRDTETYFTNLKFNRKHNFTEDSCSKNKSRDLQTLSDNDKKIVKKQNNVTVNNVNEIVSTNECNRLLEFKNKYLTNDNQSHNVRILNKIPTETSNTGVKKRLNLNLSQMSTNDQEVENKVSTEQRNNKHSITKISLINEPISDSMSSKRLKCVNLQNCQDMLNQDLESDLKRYQSSSVKIPPGDSKDNTSLKMPGLVPPRNNWPLETEPDNSDHNQQIELIKNNNITNSRQSLKLQKVSVLISPLKEHLLSRFITDFRTNINDNTKSNFKQFDGTDINAKKQRLSKFSKKPTDLPMVEKSKSEIKNVDKPFKVRKQATLKNRKAKLDVQLGRNSNSSKENLIVDNSDIDSTPRMFEIRITRLQRNKTVKSSLPEKNSSKREGSNKGIERNNMKTVRGIITRQNRNKEVPLKKIPKLKIKTIATQESYSKKSNKLKSINKDYANDCVNDVQNLEKFEKLETITTRETRNRRGKNEEMDLKNGEENSIHRTRSTQIKYVKNSCFNKIASSENAQTKSRRINDIKALESHKIEMTSNRRTRNRRIKNIKDLNIEKPKIPINNETKSKSGIICNQFSNTLFSKNSDNNKETNLSVGNLNMHSRSMRLRKRVVSSSKDFQDVANALKNIAITESESSSVLKKTTKSDNITKSDSDKVFDKPMSRIKQTKPNKSMKRKLTSEHNEILREDSFQSFSKKRYIPCPNMSTTPPILVPLRSKRLVSSSHTKISYKILFTGDKSKGYYQTVTKLGGIVTEDLSKCSILVTDKIRRTFKFLCSVARGIPIVSLNWLDDSSKVHQFIDWENYILKDPNTEAEFKFKLTESLKKSKTQKLFEGYTMILTPRITQPPISELKEMIILSGGKCLLRAPKKWPEKTVVITKKDDVQNANKLIAKAPMPIIIYSTELILTGILRQDINFEEFKLST